jgi:hypothetical protein
VRVGNAGGVVATVNGRRLARSARWATWPSNATLSDRRTTSMASDSSFDVVSRVDPQELDNALNQARKEIAGRFDFKNSIASIENTGKDDHVLSDDELKLRT